MWSFSTGSNFARCSTSLKKSPVEGELNVSVCPLKGKLHTASDCTIARSHFSIALYQLCSASRRASFCLSMVVPCFNWTTNSFHDAKFLQCSGLFSWLVKATLAFFQSFSPPLVKCICFAEKSLQQKQKRQLFYVTQLRLILSPLTKVLLKY